jgi:hypothetical protein
LGCFKQTLLALVHLRKNETLPARAVGFGISTTTAWRYVDETLEVLASWLHPACTSPSSAWATGTSSSSTARSSPPTGLPQTSRTTAKSTSNTA